MNTTPAMNPCEQLKELLVTQDQPAIEQHPELAAHVQECAACQRLLLAWNEIPAWLERLPDHPADEQLVEATGAAVKADATGHQPRKHRRFLAPSLASAAVLLAAVGLSRELLLREAPRAPLHVPAPVSSPRASTQSTSGVAGDLNSQVMQGEPDEGRARQFAESQSVQDTYAGEDRALELRGDDAPAELSGQKAKQYGQNPAESPAPAAIPLGKADASLNKRRESQAGETPVFADEVDALTRSNRKAEEAAAGEREQSAADTALHSKDTDGRETRVAQQGEAAETAGVHAPEEQKAPQDKKRSELTAQLASKEISRLQPVTSRPAPGFVTGGGADRSADLPKSATDGNQAAAFDFLGQYSQTEGLVFQPATGYWANTYIPGDPAIRLLSARLAQWDRSWLANNAAPEIAILEQDVAPIAQPFDAPADNALSLSLMSDAAAVSTRSGDTGQQLTRLRVQVGIQGIEHRSGTRPAMNVAMVVDLPPDAPDEARIAARALLDALIQSKQAGDRFSLVITGEENGFPGLVVSADDFNFGPLQLARQAILAESEANLSVPLVEPAGAGSVLTAQAYLDTYAAVQQAGAMLLQSDDPSRPLGSSEVLLISARNLADVARLATLAHERAASGITLSVFPLGQQLQSEQSEQLVLAGLGNRRYLETAADARALIEEELHASSRAVARAARLSIRLAPGVQLIGVIGSESLDAQRAQQVRDIENSMDRRLSENLGIQADRGADEEGIQIVIPSIYSGDSVTVLLDVVTDRPGAIADVTLRYKDLVSLRNGSLSGHLELPPADSFSAQPERGPTELSVLKNLLAWHFSQAVEQAADALGRGQTAEALAILRAMHATIGQARKDVPDWATDPDLVHDQHVLERYISALGSPQAATDQAFLADSLRLAAWAKTHTPLQEWK